MSVVEVIEPSSRLHLKATSPSSPHNRGAQQKSGPEVAGPRKVAWGRGVRTFVREGRAVGCGVWRTWRDAESSGTSGSCAPRRYLTPSQLFSSQRPFAETGGIGSTRRTVLPAAVVLHRGFEHNQVCAAAEPMGTGCVFAWRGCRGWGVRGYNCLTSFHVLTVPPSVALSVD